MTTERRRDAADVARDRAMLSGIPHHVLQNSQETWVAGQGAKDNFWPELVPLEAEATVARANCEHEYTSHREGQWRVDECGTCGDEVMVWVG